MRRHLSLTLSVLLIGATAAFAGIASAGASTNAPAKKPHVTIKIGSGKCVPASEFCYKPSAVSVSAGTKVTWKNTTFTIHTVTRCTTAACGGVSGGTGTQSGFGSPTISSGGKYSFTFTGKGTYVYYCQVHGYGIMHGTITVT